MNHFSYPLTIVHINFCEEPQNIFSQPKSQTPNYRASPPGLWSSLSCQANETSQYSRGGCQTHLTSLLLIRLPLASLTSVSNRPTPPSSLMNDNLQPPLKFSLANWITTMAEKGYNKGHEFAANI